MSSMELEMFGGMVQLSEMRQIWRREPFSLAEGSQVLENCWVGSQSRRRNLESFYRDQFRPNIRRLNREQTAVWVFEGPSGSGKSSAAQALRRMLVSDLYLQHVLADQGKELQVHTLIFGEALLAAQLDQFDPEGNHGIPGVRRLIEPSSTGEAKPMGTFSRKDYSAASGLMWTVFEEDILNNDDPHLAKVVIMEGNIDSGFPIIENGSLVRTLGWDRATSVLARTACDERTRDVLHVTGFERDDGVLLQSLQARMHANEQHIDLQRVQLDEEIIIIDTNGDEIPLTAYSEDFQQRVRKFRTRTSNSPRGILIADKQIADNKQRVAVKLNRTIRNSAQWHNLLLGEILGIPANRRKTAHNEFVQALPKKFDLGYLVDYSVLVQRFPEIWTTL